ncbi:conserved hypothetical protein [Vibrio chagasii]|nr:conserved hypothetical protein [Vibrio chagasii]CAH6989779.1 conserved hypothetical protein [Vibrio chagasii]CAH7002444.1 conserved hypothetical protein [Vibrio chagasii]CAH7458829.1 conserved hypothetical protein [Vibrio chagasii]
MKELNDQLKTLRLSHAAKALEQQQEQLTTYAELDFEERLSLLLESEKSPLSNWMRVGKLGITTISSKVCIANNTKQVSY